MVKEKELREKKSGFVIYRLRNWLLDQKNLTHGKSRQL